MEQDAASSIEADKRSSTAVDKIPPPGVRGLDAHLGRANGAAGRPLRVGVVVGLEWRADAGGHVKCWERLAAAAARFGKELDLTVHFLGDCEDEHRIADNVRYRIHRPTLSTRRFGFLEGVPDHTDLGLFHRALARHLSSCDVIHTTEAFFAFARTARRVARRKDIPLVYSIHTDTPGYTSVFTARIIENLFHERGLGQLLIGGLKIHEKVERMLGQRLEKHEKKAAFVLVSRPKDEARVKRTLNPDRVVYLRRGIDCDFFSSSKADRVWLAETFAVAPGRRVVVFAGRLNRGKNVMSLAEAVARLIEDGMALHLICAGDGEDRAAILECLGPNASCPGVLSPETLSRVYASADIFASPSEVEVLGNVVMEALASGLPAVVAERSGMGRFLVEGETGLIVTGAGPGPWAEALGRICRDEARLSAMKRTARRWAEVHLPTWEDVLAEDLLPVWRQAAVEAPGTA